MLSRDYKSVGVLPILVVALIVALFLVLNG